MPRLMLQQNLRLEQQLRQELNPGALGRQPYVTQEEDLQIAQTKILTALRQIIQDGEYIDPKHFDLELNRTIFSHHLKSGLGGLDKNLRSLMAVYGHDESDIARLLAALSQEGKKDLPNVIATHWLRSLESFDDKQRVLSFIEQLHECDADVASAITVVSKMPDEATLNWISSHGDVRKIPFANTVLRPVNMTKAGSDIFMVVDELYELDRELRVEGTPARIAQAVEDNTMPQSTVLPVPIALWNQDESLERICDDVEFREGRDVRRRVYRGLAALHEEQEMVQHITANAESSKELAKLLATASLVIGDADFSYPFDAQGFTQTYANLRAHLVDKSVGRLDLDAPTLEAYLHGIETDTRFESIGKILTTLASYAHYQNPEQLGLIREIIVAELGGEFQEWRYSHDKAEDQIGFLGEAKKVWTTNESIDRLVGKLDGLRAHIGAVKGSLDTLEQLYEEHYGASPDTQALETQVQMQEGALREASKKEKKKLGFEMMLLKEQLAYAGLIDSIKHLDVQNYEGVLEHAQKLAQKKSKNPLRENAQWAYNALKSPVYEQAHKVTIEAVDDLEKLLRMGEVPVAHCQNWRVDSTFNGSLLSFVADANKKVYHIRNGAQKPISMTTVRLVDAREGMYLLAENLYQTEWSEDYGIALIGVLAQKAADLSEATGKPVYLATTSATLEGALKRFADAYGVEISDARIHTRAQSKNAFEYFDCGPGKVRNGEQVSIDAQAIEFS